MIANKVELFKQQQQSIACAKRKQFLYLREFLILIFKLIFFCIQIISLINIIFNIELKTFYFKVQHFFLNNFCLIYIIKNNFRSRENFLMRTFFFSLKLKSPKNKNISIYNRDILLLLLIISIFTNFPPFFKIFFFSLYQKIDFHAFICSFFFFVSQLVNVFDFDIPTFHTHTQQRMCIISYILTIQKNIL